MITPFQRLVLRALYVLVTYAIYESPWGTADVMQRTACKAQKELFTALGGEV